MQNPDGSGVMSGPFSVHSGGGLVRYDSDMRYPDCLCSSQELTLYLDLKEMNVGVGKHQVGEE